MIAMSVADWNGQLDKWANNVAVRIAAPASQAGKVVSDFQVVGVKMRLATDTDAQFRV